MKFIWPVAILILANSCGSSTSNNERITSETDSSLVSNTEAIAVASKEFQQTITNFPNYSSVLITEDPLEAELAAGIDDLVATHNPIQFLTFTTSYHREREYEGEYDEIREKQEVTETWFFDLTYTLRAYSRKYYRDDEGRETKFLIAFFLADSLIAFSDWRMDDGQIGLEFSKKFLTSKCPTCGTSAEREVGSEGKIIDYFTTDHYSDFNNSFITHLSDLIDDEFWMGAEPSGELYTAAENVAQWPKNEGAGEPYAIEYTVSEALLAYHKFMRFVDLFSSPTTEISAHQAQRYLEYDEKASYSSESMLENETAYFFLYTRFLAVGPGVYELYAVSFTKDGILKSNFLLGSSYPSSGPDGGGEDYDYNYNSETRLLTVITTTIMWDESSEQEIRKEETNLYKLDRDGSITKSI